MMPTRSITASVILFAAMGIGQPLYGDEPLPPPFITALGSHRLFDGKLTLHMIEEGDFVIYKFEESPRIINNSDVKGTRQLTSSPTKPSIKKGAKWFVFPISADEVWIYEGGDKITLYTTVDPESKKHHQNGFYITSDGNPDIMKQAPKEFLTRLPKSMKEKFGVEEADKPVQGDLAKLQGVWKGKTGRNGIFESVMTIKGETGRLDNTTPDGNKIGLTYKLRIDEGAKPHKTIDSFDIVRYGGTGNGPDHVFGIYEFIDDNTLRFCNGFDKYPAEFKGGDPGQSILFTLKRVPEDADPADVLTALGSHQFFQGRLSVELIEKKNMISCRIKHKLPDGMSGFVETGPVKPGFEKEAKWFVYPRSEDEVWTFDGRDHLILIIFGEGHPENVSWHQLASARGANGRKVPEKVKERLPVGFLDKPEEK
jgi:hypothetical protein